MTGQPFSANQIVDEPTLLTHFPELAPLRKLVEHTDWHNDDPLRQSLRLFRWILNLPASLAATMTLPANLLADVEMNLASALDNHDTRRELLAFAALIHDIGKGATYQVQPDGTTRCPGHEAVSAQMAPGFCARFEFTIAETDFIVRLVAAHGEPYALYKRTATLPEAEQVAHTRRFEAAWGADLASLLLLAYGDLVTSHLESRRPEKYGAILSFYQQWLPRAIERTAHPTSGG